MKRITRDDTEHGVLYYKASEVDAAQAAQLKPLSQSDIDDLWSAQLMHITDKISATQFIRDIEAAHGITASMGGEV